MNLANKNVDTCLQNVAKKEAGSHKKCLSASKLYSTRVDVLSEDDM